MISWIKKNLPSREQVKNNKHFVGMRGFLQKRPYLWRLTKHSVAGGVAVALLVGFIPLPLEMTLAGLLAILIRVNLPVAILATWLTNPITFLPANYLIYRVGAGYLAESEQYEFTKFKIHWNSFDRTWDGFIDWLPSLGKAYLIGFPIVSFTAAIIGYVLVYAIWTLYENFVSKKNQKR